MSNWSATNQRSNSPTSAYHIQHSNNASTSPFSNTTNPNSRRYHNSTEPFSSFPSSSGQVIDQVDECCSYIDKLLINEAPSLHQRSRSHRHSPAVADTRNSYQKYPPSKQGNMTIGHHHYNNRHHYSYHDHYHDDSPLLPRIEFPSGQFDRLLRGSPNLDRSSESSNRYTSSVRDSSSSASLSSSSSSTASASPFSTSNSSSRLSSWKSGPFDSRKK